MNYDNHWTDLSLRFSGDGDYSYFEFTESFIDEYDKDVCLYKLDYNSSISSEISTFKSAFFNTTSVCDATGATNNITSQAWADLSDSFSALSEDAKGYIASITYTHGTETPGSEGDMADRYDYIISKYNSLGDFMNRKDTTSYQNNYNPQSANKLVFFNDTNNYVVVIIVMVSIVSISSVGVFLLLKKRHK